VDVYIHTYMVEVELIPPAQPLQAKLARTLVKQKKKKKNKKKGKV
jgi:hypothetical protein